MPRVLQNPCISLSQCWEDSSIHGKLRHGRVQKAECPSGLHHRRFRGQWLPPVKYIRALAGLVKLLDAGNARRQPSSPVGALFAFIYFTQKSICEKLRECKWLYSHCARYTAPAGVAAHRCRGPVCPVPRIVWLSCPIRWCHSPVAVRCRGPCPLRGLSTSLTQAQLALMLRALTSRS